MPLTTYDIRFCGRSIAPNIGLDEYNKIKWFSEEELQSELKKVFDDFNKLIWRLAIEEGGHQLHWNEKLNEIKQKYLKVEEKKQ